MSKRSSEMAEFLKVLGQPSDSPNLFDFNPRFTFIEKMAFGIFGAAAVFVVVSIIVILLGAWL